MLFCRIGLISTLLILLSFPTKAQQEAYSLGSGDVISISVYNEDDLSFQVRLDDSGTITFPFLGEIQAIGNTTTTVERIISQRLISEEFLVHPEVTINILEYRPFYIDGEVANPGSYPFEPGLTLRKAITIAGGFTERASHSKISIISPHVPHESSTNTELLETSIRPDDIITVNQRFF